MQKSFDVLNRLGVTRECDKQTNFSAAQTELWWHKSLFNQLWDPSNIYGIGSVQRLEVGSASLRFLRLGFLTSVSSAWAWSTVRRMSPSKKLSTRFSSRPVCNIDPPAVAEAEQIATFPETYEKCVVSISRKFCLTFIINHHFVFTEVFSA